MSHLKSIGDFEENRARKALDLLVRDRDNEFRELANATGFPRTTKGWEEVILKFCLDFDECFKALTEIKSPYDSDTADHNQIHKCMTLMRQIAKGKKTMNEISHIQNITYTIAQEFKSIYKRIG